MKNKKPSTETYVTQRCHEEAEEESKEEYYASYYESKVEDERFSMDKRVDDKYFIGHCYVCDKKICQSDIEGFLLEDFTKVIQKVLGDLSSDYVIVVTDDDGLCGSCRSLVARISELEAELQTVTHSLRALLKLKYSLPLPHLEERSSDEMLGLQAKLQQLSSFAETNVKEGATQSNKSSIDHRQDSVKQIERNTDTNKRKNKQAIESPVGKKLKHEIKIVSSINEVEHLEKEQLEVRCSDRSNACLEQASAHNRLSENISGKTELATLLNDDCLVEESLVVTESKTTVKTLKQQKNKKSNFRLLKCGRCSFKTKSSELMKTHMLSFLNKEGFYCSICNYAYHINDRFKRHAISHSDTSKDKRCMFCDIKVHDELHMRFHIEAIHKENSFSHRCSICNRIFMFEHSMRRHQRIKHKTGEIYECENCDKTFNDKIKYDSHVEYYHRETLACKYCKRQYYTVEKLIIHERAKHRFESKQYHQCSYCPKRFIRQEMLLLHEKHHTEEFAFRCDVCDYGFHEEESLERHKKNCKHGIWIVERGSPKLSKPTTKAGYRCRLLIKEHARKQQREPFGAHESLVCDVCGKIITTRAKYRIHREMHNDPEPFQCRWCGNKFRYKNNLSVHLKTIHKFIVEMDSL